MSLRFFKSMEDKLENQGIRINKYLSEAGICSRREADRQVAEGNVTVDGVTAEMGTRVLPGPEEPSFPSRQLHHPR